MRKHSVHRLSDLAEVHEHPERFGAFAGWPKRKRE